MSKLLVVVDMQNDFIDGILGIKEAQSIVPNVVKKIEEYRKNGDDVFFTKDTHYYLDYMETEEGKNLPVEHCISYTNGWEICDALKPYVASLSVFTKETFGSLDLANYLDAGISSSICYKEIEVVGVCTGICVLSQAVMCKSAQPNAHIVVDAACCACVTPHSHDVAIEAMKTLQIEIRNEGKEPWRE